MVRLLLQCPSHLSSSLQLLFSSNEAAHIHPYGLMGPNPSLQQTQPNIYIPIWDFLKGVLVLIQNPTQQSNGLSLTPSYQRTLIPARRHCHLIRQTEVPRKRHPTSELQVVTTSARVSAILYFHRSLVYESGIWTINIIHKAS